MNEEAKRMMLDHHTRLSIAREHADHLRETMRASRRTRRSDDSGQRVTARIYRFPKPEARLERDAAA